MFDGLLAALGLILGEQGRSVPAWSTFGALAVLAVWQIALALHSGGGPGRAFRIESFFRPTHYVQGVLQGLIYVYVSLYWGEILPYAPLLLVQALVGYLCDIQLAWSRGRNARVGLGIIPVILSTNLFTWFHEEYFYCQLLMVALAFFSKEFLTWTIAGRRRHIFNPSAFPLAVVSLILLVSGEETMTRGVDLVGAFELPPNFYEVIFLLGLVTQALFLTTPVSLGAVATLSLWFGLSILAFGEPLSEAPIAAQVFLGLTFLVTDPATTPRSGLGRLLFGLAYGTGVFATYVLLRWLGKPAYFDKLLVVPLLNLTVPLFDRFCDRLERGWFSFVGQTPAWVGRFGWLALYILLFAAVDPLLKAPRTRKLTVLPPVRAKISVAQTRLVANRIYCRTVFPEAFEPFGLRTEFANLSAIRSIYRGRPPARTATAGN
ncbi:MAG: RnfABCDGE type electron transport complex subunit D [Planctomycetales bacterium]